MIQINLLPWREENRHLLKMQFMAMSLLSLILAILTILIIHLYLKTVLNAQEKTNTFLQNELGKEQAEFTILNKQKKEKQGLEDQINFLIDLKNKSYRAVRLLDAIAKSSPQSLTLTKVTREGNQVTLIGKAQNNTQVTFLMKTLASQPGFKSPTLTEITASDQKNKTESEGNFQIKIEQTE